MSRSPIDEHCVGGDGLRLGGVFGEIPSLQRIGLVVVEFAGDDRASLDGTPLGVAPAFGTYGVAPCLPVLRVAVERLLVLGVGGFFDAFVRKGDDRGKVVALQVVG